jgi:hypothetical protein
VHHLPLGQAEVSDFVQPILKEDVGGFEISVDNIESSQILEAFADLPKHI